MQKHMRKLRVYRSIGSSMFSYLEQVGPTVPKTRFQVKVQVTAKVNWDMMKWQTW